MHLNSKFVWVPALLLSMLIGAESFSADRAVPADNDSAAQRGKALFETRACRSCHMLDGEGALIGPALDQVILRRTKTWLRQWLRNPASLKPGTMMVEFDWNEDQLNSLFVYLEQFKQPVVAPAILSGENNMFDAGKALIDAYQCWACHNAAGVTGRPIYPDLTTVKERRTAGWVRNWLRDPQAVTPGTFMPTFPFTDGEIEAIVAYLYQR